MVVAKDKKCPGRNQVCGADERNGNAMPSEPYMICMSPDNIAEGNCPITDIQFYEPGEAVKNERDEENIRERGDLKFQINKTPFYFPLKDVILSLSEPIETPWREQYNYDDESMYHAELDYLLNIRYTTKRTDYTYVQAGLYITQELLYQENGVTEIIDSIQEIDDFITKPRPRDKVFYTAYKKWVTPFDAQACEQRGKSFEDYIKLIRYAMSPVQISKNIHAYVFMGFYSLATVGVLGVATFHTFKALVWHIQAEGIFCILMLPDFT